MKLKHVYEGDILECDIFIESKILLRLIDDEMKEARHLHKEKSLYLDGIVNTLTWMKDAIEFLETRSESVDANELSKSNE